MFGPSSARRAFGLAMIGLAWLLGAEPSGASAGSRHVLVVYAANRLLPSVIEGDRGILDALLADNPSTELSAEFLDHPRYDTAAATDAIIALLRQKYAARPPDVIIAGGEDALAFLLSNRAALFPSTPIVHAAVSLDFIRAHGDLPGDVVGVPVDMDYAATIDEALKLRPEARRLIVVTGVATADREWEAAFRLQFGKFESSLKPEYLVGLPAGKLSQTLAGLGPDSIVFTPGYFEDSEGQTFVPRETVRSIAASSNAPVFAPYSTYLGTGIVGGKMITYEAMGREAGRVANRLLDGVAPAALNAPTRMPSTLNVDWRQIKRWGIPESKIPDDAVVRFREPSLWDLYKVEIVIVAAALALLSVSVLALLIERSQRKRAEVAEARHRSDLVRAMRLAVAGELTGSIAHEINQPLGAIMSNVAAADMMLDSSDDRREDLRAIMSDIRRDNDRATQVIRRLRTLFAKHETEHVIFGIDEAMSDVANILRAEAQRRRVGLTIRQPVAETRIMGDRIEIGQVLINLAINAMDAVADVDGDRRRIEILAAQIQKGARVSVRDRGAGIPQDSLTKVFESFFTTKRGGMGLGLSIVRTIVSAHGGKVWATNEPEGGATFHVELPAAT